MAGRTAFSVMLAQTEGKAIYPPLRDLGPIIKVEITGPQSRQRRKCLFGKCRPSERQRAVGLWHRQKHRPHRDGQFHASRCNAAHRLLRIQALRDRPSAAAQCRHGGRLQKDAIAVRSGPGFAGNKPTTEPRLVEFLFATTRKRQTTPTQVSFTRERGKDLIFGAAAVRIPEDHKIGRIELPKSWKLWGINLKEEPLQDEKHFVVRKVVSLSEDEWGQIIKEKNAKTALVFVHGFNTSFEHALYRNARLCGTCNSPACRFCSRGLQR